jgi:hypothetical protein
MMKFSSKAILGVALCALLTAPAMAAGKKDGDEIKVMTEQSSGAYADGTIYERHTTIMRAPIKPGSVTFYYYDPRLGAIVSGNELTDDIIALWDANNNRVIDNHEFYTNAFVAYEPLEYTKRTFQDVNGQKKLTKQEYTYRLQQVPYYKNLEKDGKEGLNLWEFLGVGFQDADLNNNNQVGYDELRTAFFAKEGIIRKPLKMNN